MDQNNDNLIDTDSNKEKADISQEDQQKYQQVLDEYSQQLESADKSKDLKQHEIPPQDIAPTIDLTDQALSDQKPPLPPPDQKITNPPSVLTEITPPPSSIKKPQPETTPQDKDTVKNIDDVPIKQKTPVSKKPVRKKFDLFKYLFYISVIVFLVLVVLLVKDYLALQKVNNQSLIPVPSLTPAPDNDKNDTIGTDSCVLNDISYQIDDIVPSQDKCNTCSCQQTESGPQIVCIEIDCQKETPASSSAQEIDEN